MKKVPLRLVFIIQSDMRSEVVNMSTSVSIKFDLAKMALSPKYSQK